MLVSGPSPAFSVPRGRLYGVAGPLSGREQSQRPRIKRLNNFKGGGGLAVRSAGDQNTKERKSLRLFSIFDENVDDFCWQFEGLR